MSEDAVRVVIAGAGKLGKALFDCMEGDGRWRAVAFIDDGLAGGTLFDLPIYASDAYDRRMASDAFMAIGFPATRRKMLEKLAPLELEWHSYFDPRAMVPRRTEIGRGTIVLGQTMISSSTTIGEFSYISSFVALGADAVIGSFCSLMIGVTVGESIVGDDCVLGIRSSCLDHAVLGDGVTVAPYTLVRKPIPAGALVMGSPARIVRRSAA